MQTSIIIHARQPQIFRMVIDDVIRNIKPEFDEYGVSEDVLAELQHVSITFQLPFPRPV